MSKAANWLEHYQFWPDPENVGNLMIRANVSTNQDALNTRTLRRPSLPPRPTPRRRRRPYADPNHYAHAHRYDSSHPDADLYSHLDADPDHHPHLPARWLHGRIGPQQRYVHLPATTRCQLWTRDRTEGGSTRRCASLPDPDWRLFHQRPAGRRRDSAS